MTALSWQTYFYDGSDRSHPPFRTGWIEAEREEDAIRIAKESLKRGQCVELVRPRWEGGYAPILVSSEGAHWLPTGRTA